MKDIQKIKEFFSKPLEETTFKKGDKVTYLGHPGEITGVNKEMTGAITYNVSYDKGQGKTKASNISNKGGEIKMASPSLDEAKKETAVDMAKKQLDALGVKYEMSGNEFRPFKAIYKPTNKPDRWYDEFDDVIHLFNLGSAVKQSMDEAKSEDSYEVVWTDRDYKKHSKVFKNDPKGAPDNAKKKAEAFKKSLEDKDKKSKEGLYRSIDLNEAKEDKVDTITMDIPLFLRMLEYSREDAAQDVDLHDVTEKANSLGKEKSILSMEDYDAIVGAAEDAPKTEIDEATDYMKRRKAMDDYFTSKKDKPKKPHNPTPSGKTDYMKRREKDLAEAILNKLKK